MPFEKGRSGNPAGRPARAAELARRCRVALGDDIEIIVGTLLSVARDPRAPHRDRVAACRELLSRGWGRPPRLADAAGAVAAAELQRLISPDPPPAAPVPSPDPRPAIADPLASLRALVRG